LFGQTLGSRGDFRQRLAFAGAGVIDNGDVASLSGTVNSLEIRVTVTEQVDGAFNVFIGDLGGFALGRQSLVFRNFEFGSRFDGGSELKRLAAAELDFFNVRARRLRKDASNPAWPRRTLKLPR
jgi:hypothetical protein